VKISEERSSGQPQLHDSARAGCGNYLCPPPLLSSSDMQFPGDAQTANLSDFPIRRRTSILVVLCLLASAVLPSVSRAQAPVFAVTPEDSSIKFNVKASVAISGNFDKWEAALTCKSPDVSTGVLDLKIQADSVDTGSGMKNGKLKGKDFFDVNQNPLITFHSTKLVQTAPNTNRGGWGLYDPRSD
jgi:hypothetical protein